MIVVDMGVLFAGEDYPGVNYMIPDIKYLEDNRDKVKAICFTHAHGEESPSLLSMACEGSIIIYLFAPEFRIRNDGYGVQIPI